MVGGAGRQHLEAPPGTHAKAVSSAPQFIVLCNSLSNYTFWNRAPGILKPDHQSLKSVGGVVHARNSHGHGQTPVTALYILHLTALVFVLIQFMQFK